jgi:hypothetical protein
MISNDIGLDGLIQHKVILYGYMICIYIYIYIYTHIYIYINIYIYGQSICHGPIMTEHFSCQPVPDIWHLLTSDAEAWRLRKTNASLEQNQDWALVGHLSDPGWDHRIAGPSWVFMCFQWLISLVIPYVFLILDLYCWFLQQWQLTLIYLHIQTMQISSNH